MSEPFDHETAGAHGASKNTEAQRIERERKAYRVDAIARQLYAKGSLGLVIPYGNPDTTPIKEGLLASYGDDRVKILRAEGTVQGKPKDPKPTARFLEALNLFKERTGARGLYVLERFDFRSGDEEGTPEIKEFFEGIINIAAAPQVLAIGQGRLSDLTASEDYKPEFHSAFTRKLGGIAAWVEDSMIFKPPGLQISPVQQRLFNSETGSQPHLGYTQLP